MANKVSIINMKGGVGKSTLSVNLAWHFAATHKWRKRVLLVDLDPQFNASQYLLGVKKYEDIMENEIPTIWDVFEQLTQVPGSVKKPLLESQKVIYHAKKFYKGCIDLIPSRLELAYSLRNPGQKEHLLAKLINKIEDNYDIIILDCAPTESFLTTAAYLTSDYILVPVRPEYLSSIGLPLLVKSMNEFKQFYNDHPLELAGVVFNATSNYVPEESKSKLDVKKIAKDNGWYVFEKEISYSRSYPKGAREGKPIFRTSYARAKQTDKFKIFAEEFAKRIGL